MAHALTQPQKRLMRELLRIGRWNNESEIIRYGLHLVAKEIQADQARNLAPIAKNLLLRSYRTLSAQDLAEEKKLEKASAYPTSKDLE